MRSLTDLTKRELLALAISSEEEDGRVYADFAHELRETYPDSATVFVDMAAEEDTHRRSLVDLFVARFGPHVPLVKREDVRGWVRRESVWRVRARGITAWRRHVERMEQDAARFYEQVAERTSDAGVRRLVVTSPKPSVGMSAQRLAFASDGFQARLRTARMRTRAAPSSSR